MTSRAEKDREISDELKNTILDLISDLRTVFDLPAELSDLNLVEFFFKQLDSSRIMKNVIEKILPHTVKIRDKDVEFFLTTESLFSALPPDRVTYYGELLSNGSRLLTEELDTIWTYFECIITYAEQYRKIK